MSRRTFTLEFKYEAVNFANQHSINEAAERYDVHPNLMRLWVTNLTAKAEEAAAQADLVKRLEQENRELRKQLKAA